MSVLFRYLVTAALFISGYGMLEYEITHTWNGGSLVHDPVKMRISSEPNFPQDVRVHIEAPFFHNEPPPAEPGEPLMGLWNYEVVEAFFLNDKEQYLEIELAPGGQHIDLLLYHPRNVIRHTLPMHTSTQITGDKWSGYCTIPGEYFPFNVTLFNAYAVHNGKDGTRHYEALYPADPNETQVEFHNLTYFKPIDMSQVLEVYPTEAQSQYWIDALDGTFRYFIKTEWNSVPISHPDPVEITLHSAQGGVKVYIKAPFFNDSAPDAPEGSFLGLWDYEVAEIFFLNDNDEYLEVEFGPHGQYILLLLKGSRNSIKDSLPISYTANISPGGYWEGEAIIPAAYFPPNVTKMNAYAIHNGNARDERVYEALNPAPKDDPNYPSANFHRLDLFKKVDFEFQLADNSEYSDVWLDALNPPNTEHTTNVPPTTDAANTISSTDFDLTYTITKNWRGEMTSIPPITIGLNPQDDFNFLITVDAPFFNDPIPDDAPAGDSFDDLEKLEVVEFYFLNNQSQYLQIQLGPGGQHNVHLFNGVLSTIRSNLPIESTTEILGDRWIGNVIVPREYLPLQVTKFNAFAINGEGLNRKYYALYPAPLHSTKPNFHVLEHFQDFDMSLILPEISTPVISQFWQDSLDGIFRYKIDRFIDGSKVNHDPIEVTFQGFQAGVEINVTSPMFSKTPNPNNPNGGSLCQLENEEVVKITFGNQEKEFVNIELGPWGNYFIYFQDSFGNIVKEGNNLDYFVPNRQIRTLNEPMGLWEGSALVPIKYFPLYVNRFNIYASHFYKENREWEALRLPFNNNLNNTKSDFDKINKYTQMFYFTPLEPENRGNASFWDNFISKNKTPKKSNINRCNQLKNRQVFEIKKDWNGENLLEDPIKISLQTLEDRNVLFSVEAPYYGDPSSAGPSGRAFMGLWNYEVVEVFFLNDQEQYLVVEISPHGQHLALLVSGRRRPIRHSLPLNVITSIDGNIWSADVVIPNSYFPPNVNKFNAYASSGQEPDRLFSALYPADKTLSRPDFHSLKFFKPIDLSQLIPNDLKTTSLLWNDAIQGIFRYTVNKSLNNSITTDSPIEVVMKGFEAGVELNVTASYYNDGEIPKNAEIFEPTGEYEMVELVFLNDASSYLSVKIGPNGHRRVTLGQFDGEKQEIRSDLPIDYFAELNGLNSGVSGIQGEWKGSVLIPPNYFPVSVTKFNIYSSHGQGHSRSIMALYPTIENEPKQQQQQQQQQQLQAFDNPDLYFLNTFHQMDFEFLVINNKKISDIWINSLEPFQPKTSQVGLLKKSNSLVNLERIRTNNKRRRPKPHQVSPTRSLETSNNLSSGILSNKPRNQPITPHPTQLSGQPLNLATKRPNNNTRQPQNPTKLLRTSRPTTILKPFEEERENSLNLISNNNHPLLPPPHSTCFSPGLVRDARRCQIFYECVLENGEWQVFNWRCSRGLVFDSEKIACVRGFC